MQGEKQRGEGRTGCSLTGQFIPLLLYVLIGGLRWTRKGLRHRTNVAKKTAVSCSLLKLVFLVRETI